MSLKSILAVLTILAAATGCASKQTAADQQPTSSQTATETKQAEKAQPSKAQPSSPGGRIVKSRNGQFEGEIVGKPAAKSKFAKLEIGMTMREVNKLIGVPNDMTRHETGKRWIPWYFGNDAQRLQTLYQGEGCLTYTGGNVFGGGDNELIRIAVDPKGGCFAE